MTKILRLAVAGILAGGCLIGSSGLSRADDPEFIRGTTLFAGFDARDRTHYPYAGLVHHFSGSLTDDSILFRAFGDYSFYRYDTTGVATHAVRAEAQAFDVMAGYQKVLSPVMLRGFVGLDYENHDLSPNNPFDSNRGSHVGVKVQGEVETAYDLPYYGSFIGSFGSAVDRYWVRLRGGYSNSLITIGPETLFTGDDQFDEQRVGAFLTFKGFNPVLISVSTGFSDTNRRRGGGSAYGTLEVSTSF